MKIKTTVGFNLELGEQKKTCRLDEENHLSYNNQQASTTQFTEVMLQERDKKKNEWGLEQESGVCQKTCLEDNQSLKFV